MAQKEANTWYFGNSAGLDFNFNPPRPLLNGMANSQEGCASISDNSGQLLFYTNGITVVNRLHQTMPNGNNIAGDLSSTSNVIIVPMPDNDSLYYLFTIGSTGQTIKGFRYSVVNMRADGGLGAVIEKNTLVAPGYEKLAAVRHCNRRDVWVVIRNWATDEYHCYLLSPAGLSAAPVISHTGLVVGGTGNNSIGTLKFSADATKLAAVHSTENDLVELMTFDNATGQLSNPVTFKANNLSRSLSFTGSYAAEFSPGGNLLYVSASNSVANPCVLYQFNITVPNAAAIEASRQVIAQPSPWYAGALQTGPDGKIYLALWQDTAISVIENPDVYGAGCNFRLNKISFGPYGQPVQFGLPVYIQSDLTGNLVPYNFSRAPGSCANPAVQFVLNRTNGIDSLKWDFGDGGQSQVVAPLHTYAAAGLFTVTLRVYSTGCNGVVVTSVVQKTITIAGNTPLLGPDTLACSINNLELTVALGNASYLWNTGSTSNKITVSTPGRYWVEAAQQGCILYDTVNVALLPKPLVNTGNDTTVCSGNGIVLSAGNTTAASYLWNTGESTPAITVFKPGQYVVTVTDNSCSASDSVNVVWGDCPFFIPNAFSPNGDGVNDFFGVLNGVTLADFSLQIYDRYGHVIFVSKNVNDKWNGTFKGKKMNTGTYAWQIIYVNGLGYTKWLKGSVLLLH
jgi:gliding motility-associated-like protein